MSLGEALNAVASFYVPGVAKYYSALSPDPWMRAHDELDSVLLMNDKKAEQIACEVFIGRTKELVSRFVSEGVRVTGVSAVDAVHLADVSNFRNWSSIKNKCCVSCESKNDLLMKPFGDGTMQVKLVCRHCVEKGVA